MKKFFTLIFVLLLSPIAFAEDEFATSEMLNTVQENEVTLNEEENLIDNVTEEFKVLEQIGKNEESENSEQPLLTKILKSEITRTDIPSYLLKEQLTFTYEKGLISETQYYGAYRGSISGLISPHNYSTKYNNNATEFGVMGKFRDRDYDFKLMFRPVPVSGQSYLDNFFGDIYIVSSKIPHHKIIAGFQRTQKGMEGGMGQYTLPFYARSQIARNFGNTRSLTAKIVGDYQYADYSVSVGSSSPYLVHGFPGAETALWLNVKPFGPTDGKFGRLTVGGGLSAGHNDISYTTGNVYVGYKHKKLWTNFEAAISDGYNGSAGVSSNKACGYAFTAGWKFNPHLQLIGRIDQFDPNRDKHGNLKREYTAGINWFVKGQALRFIFNYVYCQNQNAKDSHKLIIGSQVML